MGNNVLDILDMAVIKAIQNHLEIYTIQEGSSNHNPIILQVGNEEEYEEHQQEK